MTIKLIPENKFIKALKKLPPHRALAAANSLPAFVLNPSKNSFDFRPLCGSSDYYIIDCGPGDRIILRKDAADTYAAVDVGPHDNIYRRWNRKR